MRQTTLVVTLGELAVIVWVLMRPLSTTFSFAALTTFLSGTVYAQAPANPLAEADTDTEFGREGLLGLGFHMQAGLGVGTVLGQDSSRVQVHPRAVLRYDRKSYALRLLFRHQRLTTVDGDTLLINVGHSELSFSPAIVYQYALSETVALEGGLGLSIGVFARYETEASAIDPKNQYGIPLTGELSGSLVWQWRSGLSFEWGADYRPVVFRGGIVEHLFSNSLTASFDL